MRSASGSTQPEALPHSPDMRPCRTLLTITSASGCTVTLFHVKADKITNLHDAVLPELQAGDHRSITRTVQSHLETCLSIRRFLQCYSYLRRHGHITGTSSLSGPILAMSFVFTADAITTATKVAGAVFIEVAQGVLTSSKQT